MNNKEKNIIEFVANNWRNEQEYGGRMETWCFYCGEYQGERGDENNHQHDCLHLLAVELFNVCPVCGSGCCLNELHAKEE
jgi:hypothetical protein